MQRKISAVAAGALTVLLCAAACQKSETGAVPPPSGEATLATVGGKIITLGEFNREYERYKTQLHLDDIKDGPEDQQIRKTVLERMINDMLLLAEADRMGVAVTDEELKNEITALLGEYDQARLTLNLGKMGISYGQWKADVEKGMRIRTLVLQQIDARIGVTPAETRAYYDENADEFHWPERVRALQIMVNDETAAEQIRKKLLAGADFATIAKERSQSPDAATGGDLGYFSRGQMPPEFEEAVFNLKAGQISEVIESIYGFHLFKAVGRESPRMMTFDEAQERIRALLISRKREEEFNRWIENLHTQANVKADLALLAPSSS